MRAFVNFFFKKLVLRNYWPGFYQIPQECSLDSGLKLLFDIIEKSGLWSDTGPKAPLLSTVWQSSLFQIYLCTTIWQSSSFQIYLCTTIWHRVRFKYNFGLLSDSQICFKYIFVLLSDSQICFKYIFGLLSDIEFVSNISLYYYLTSSSFQI